MSTKFMDRVTTNKTLLINKKTKRRFLITRVRWFCGEPGLHISDLDNGSEDYLTTSTVKRGFDSGELVIFNGYIDYTLNKITKWFRNKILFRYV